MLGRDLKNCGNDELENYDIKEILREEVNERKERYAELGY